MKFLDKSKAIDFVKNSKAEGKKIILIPTMGNLHKGHERLVDIGRNTINKITNAKTIPDDIYTVVSIFVNRSQFNNNDDYSNYPRTVKSDTEKLKKLGVSAVFIPSEEDFFPKEVSTKVSLYGEVVSCLCAKYRKNHFDGVATVVTKLLLLIQPDIAVFGLKDFQQWLIINKIVKDLNIKVSLVGVPTVRTEKNTALSSRLSRLSEKDRKKAESIFPALKLAIIAYQKGDKSIKDILNTVKQNLNNYVDSIEYLEFRDSNDLSLITKLGSKKARLFIAVYIEDVRLIDNVASYEEEIIYNSYV